MKCERRGQYHRSLGFKVIALLFLLLPNFANTAKGAESDWCDGAARSQLIRTRLNSYIFHHYRVKRELLAQILTSVCNASKRRRVDPLLVLAVVAVESGFNPKAQGGGESSGLMQVVASAHPEKLARHGGRKGLKEVNANLMVGTWVLREYLDRDHNIASALQRYNGARFDKKRIYSTKVLSTQQALTHIALGSTARL